MMVYDFQMVLYLLVCLGIVVCAGEQIQSRIILVDAYLVLKISDIFFYVENIPISTMVDFQPLSKNVL